MTKRRRKRRLKIKNIVICCVIVLGVIVSTVMLFKSNSLKTKTTNDVKKTINKTESNDNIDENSNVLKKEFISIKIGDNEPSVLDYLSNMDGSSEIIWDKLVPENNKVYNAGTFIGKINVNNKIYEVKLEVKDDEKPTISGVKDITIIQGSKIDFYDGVTITDNSHDKLIKKIDGKYDVNKVGTYNLSMTVTDNGGNTSTSDFKLVVKEKITSNSNSNNNSNSNSNSNSNTNTANTTSKGYKIEKKNGIYYIKGILIANKSYPLPSTYNPGSLTNSFMTAYNKMKKDYDKKGFKSYPKLSIRSGFRSYSTQKTLYNNYVARDGKKAADRYSARPGHSEHQSGFAADLNTISDTYGNTDSGKWLANNCWKYGFILRYPKGKENKTGYTYESWHFRYIGDTAIAKALYNNGNWISLEEYLGIDSVYK